MMSEKDMKAADAPEVVSDAALDEAAGGIGLLLPAVQKVRESGPRVVGDGSVKPGADGFADYGAGTTSL
ncbi:MAG: hypothetical protein ACMVO5_11880 [Polymorphobacter sp.]|uniref:hypothetical protein n=1 Tax=Polymorphobacter sp. TaxID=1909290 RepID=UPI003A83E202